MNWTKENKLTLPIALILFLLIVFHFVSVLWSARKLCMLEAFIYAAPEVALFLLYVHLTIRYTIDKKYAVYPSWGLPVTLISIALGKLSGLLYSINYLMEQLMKHVNIIVIFALYGILIFTASFLKSLLTTCRDVIGMHYWCIVLALCVFMIILLVLLHRINHKDIIIFDAMAILSAIALCLAT